MKQLKTKVLIIGAGPAGMALALYLKRANVPFLLLEKGTPGGKLNQLSNIDNYLGYSSISGPNLALKFYEQITSLKIELINEEVFSLLKKGKHFLAQTSTYQILADYVVLALGVMMKKITTPGYNRFLNKGISNCAVCDGYLYRNKPIAVIGNNIIADHEYIYLTNLSNHVYRIDNEVEKVIKYIGHDCLEKVVTDKKTYEIKAAFVYDKEVIDQTLIQRLKLKTINGRILTNRHYETNVKHIYAIGDVIKKDLYQVVGAVNDASLASINIIRAIKDAQQ